MTSLTLKALLLATLVAQPLMALADHDEDYRRGRGADELQWRLGAELGYGGNSIYFRYPGERHWLRAPGSAIDVGEGWVIGTDRHSGGYGIYRWNGRDWQRMPGAAVEIGGSFQSPWVVNDRGERFRWAGNRWQQEAVVGFRNRDERTSNEHRGNERSRDYDDWDNSYRDRDNDHDNERGSRNGRRNSRGW
jgi:hypothetical protein